MRRRGVGLIAGAALALGAVPGGALAYTGTIVDAGDKVAGRPDLTYQDLVREAVPSLVLSPTDHRVEGHLRPRPRHLAGPNYEGDPPDPAVLGMIESLNLMVGGKVRLALLADFGQDPDRVQDTALLMLFDDSPKPKLLDAVDVGMDRDTVFAEDALVPLGAGDSVLITMSEHSNSEQTYDTAMAILVRGDRFQLIATPSTLSDRFCGYQRTELPTFATKPDGAGPYPELDLTVTETLKLTDEVCPDDVMPAPYTRSFHASYRWDAAKRRFVGDETGLEALDKENEARF
ncbi:MAG TPA: hypothetical protein VHW60_00200 [Caulobacteraceae bacterium]|nr:hypothetical protein [Caulobacteraceae bacterium]